MVHFRNDDKLLGIYGENRIFHRRITFSNLRHPQFCIEDKFWKLKGGNLLGNLQTIHPNRFAFSGHLSFSHNVNYAKKYERQSDVKRW